MGAPSVSPHPSRSYYEIGVDKQTDKFYGYAIFVYKTVEAAHAGIVDPNKSINGHDLLFKLANTNSKKGKLGVLVAVAAISPGSLLPNQFGIPGTFSSYTGNGLLGASGMGNHLNTALSPYGAGTYTLGLSTAGLQYWVDSCWQLRRRLWWCLWIVFIIWWSRRWWVWRARSGLLSVSDPTGVEGMPLVGNPEGAHYPLSSLACQS